MWSESVKMAGQKQLSERDRAEIVDVINAVAFILDSRGYDRLGEVFAPDMLFENPGRLKADGLDNVIAAFKGFASPAISHFITNTILSTDDAGTVRALSKALSIRQDKSLVAAEYSDVMTRTDQGWRIASRSIKALG
ncbi:MAG: nuclear transport factor 2 family protein [Rhizobiales bacterium]|nr:nuclear transport factor 2 family protein [Hyphomicrobiales bacterium]